MAPVDLHHILVDGIPLCQMGADAPWSRFFTCFYQWEATARQAAMKIAGMSSNKGKHVEVVKGRCICSG